MPIVKTPLDGSVSDLEELSNSVRAILSSRIKELKEERIKKLEKEQTAKSKDEARGRQDQKGADNPGTIEDTARRIGVSVATYGKWERGKALPSAEYLIKIADSYEVSVDYLLGRTDYRDVA